MGLRPYGAAQRSVATAWRCANSRLRLSRCSAVTPQGAHAGPLQPPAYAPMSAEIRHRTYDRAH